MGVSFLRVIDAYQLWSPSNFTLISFLNQLNGADIYLNHIKVDLIHRTLGRLNEIACDEPDDIGAVEACSVLYHFDFDPHDIRHMGIHQEP